MGVFSVKAAAMSASEACRLSMEVWESFTPPPFAEVVV